MNADEGPWPSKAMKEVSRHRVTLGFGGLRKSNMFAPGLIERGVGCGVSFLAFDEELTCPITLTELNGTIRFGRGVRGRVSLLLG